MFSFLLHSYHFQLVLKHLSTNFCVIPPYFQSPSPQALISSYMQLDFNITLCKSIGAAKSVRFALECQVHTTRDKDGASSTSHCNSQPLQLNNCGSGISFICLCSLLPSRLLLSFSLRSSRPGMRSAGHVRRRWRRRL